MNRLALVSLVLPFLLTGCQKDNNEQPNEEYGNPIFSQTRWEWSKTSKGYQAKAIIKYDNNKVQKVDANVTESVIETKTCVENGLIRYTASLDIDGIVLSDYKDEIIMATGHEYNQFMFDKDYHYKSCSCGAIESKEAHEFGKEEIIEAPDGWKTPGRKKKVCSICNYEVETSVTDHDEYRQQVIEHAKQALDDFGEIPDVKDAQILLKDKTIPEVYDYLTKEEIFSLPENYLKKLLSIMFDFRKVADVSQGACFKLLENDPEVVLNTTEEDSTYGLLSVIDVKKQVELKPVPVGRNHYEFYGESKYRSFNLASCPNIVSGDDSMVLYVNAPYAAKVGFYGDGTAVSKVKYESGLPVGINYFKFDKNDESKSIVELKEGWNTIVFTKDFIENMLANGIFRFDIDVISESGIAPGVWKFSSLIAKGADTFDIYEKLNKLPELESVDFYQYSFVQEIYNTYFTLSSEVDNLFNKGNQIRALKAQVDSFVSLPLGNYALPDDYDSTLYETEKGKCFKYTKRDKNGIGVLHGNNVKEIKSPFSCFGFVVKGYDGAISLFNPAKSADIVNFKKVPLDNEWSLYLLDSEQIKIANKVDFGADCWFRLYIKYKNDVSSDIYQSQIYSFDAKASTFNNIVANVPNDYSEITFENYKYAEGAYYLSTLMTMSEIEKCNKYDFIVDLIENHSIKCPSFTEIKEQVSLDGGTKVDWNHHNGKAAYFHSIPTGSHLITLPLVSYKFFNEIVFEGEFKANTSFGFDSSNFYTYPVSGSTDLFFIVTISSDINSKVYEKIEIFDASTQVNGNMDNRSYLYYSSVVFSQTKEITDEEIKNGEKPLKLYVSSPNDGAFCIGGASISY